MSYSENNNEDWKELRGRIDSLANIIFVLSGGAITLSATALIQLQISQCELASEVIYGAIISWVSLLSAIFIFALLKVHLILQAYARTNNTNFYNNVDVTNTIGWVIGVLGISAFFFGLSSIVFVACQVISG